MSSAKTFSLELDKFFTEEVEGQTLLVTQKLGMEALSRVVLRSPVYTGAFRNTWSVSIGDASDILPVGVDPSGSATIAREAPKITGLTSPKVVYLQSNSPYGNRLENGYSRQAPNGMIAVTFAELQAFFA